MQSIVLSFNKCKSVLNKKKEKYTDQEIEQIRQYLYLLAKIEVEQRKTKQDETSRLNVQSEQR